MAIRSTQELLAYELNDIRDAETQAADAIASMRDEAEEEVADLFDRRLEEGARILRAVEDSLEEIEAAGGKEHRNAAARGLIEDTQRLLREIETDEMKQAAMIAGAQKLEHYCIAAWGTVRALASELGQNDLADEMQRAVEEGYRWDEELSAVAESRINPEALEADMEDEEEDAQR